MLKEFDFDCRIIILKAKCTCLSFKTVSFPEKVLFHTNQSSIKLCYIKLHKKEIF